ncbi:MAG: ABC transporter permease [Planctomycetota bacterium]
MAAWHITAKDVSLLLRDRRTLAVLVALPMAFIAIIGLTSGKFLALQNSGKLLKIAVVDLVDYDAIGSEEFADGAGLDAEESQRQRRQARNLLVKIVNGIQERPGVKVMTVRNWRAEVAADGLPDGDAEAAAALVADGAVNASLTFGPDFYRNVRTLAPGAFGDPETGGPAAVDISTDVGDSSAGTASGIEAMLLVSLFQEIPRVTACLSGRGGPPGVAGPCAELAAETDGEPLKLNPPSDDPNEAVDADMYNDIVPSYTVMFVFFLVNIMARSFLHERELGTFRRLRVAPIPPLSLLIGKTVPFLLISLTQTALLFVVGRMLFGMSWGSEPLYLIPVVVCTSLAATALGLMVATLIKTDAQVSAYATSAVIILAGISGCFMPRKWLPDLLQEISLGTPHAWALIAYDEILNDPLPEWGLVANCCGMLLAFAAGFLVVGAVRFEATEGA